MPTAAIIITIQAWSSKSKQSWHWIVLCNRDTFVLWGKNKTKSNKKPVRWRDSPSGDVAAMLFSRCQLKHSHCPNEWVEEQKVSGKDVQLPRKDTGSENRRSHANRVPCNTAGLCKILEIWMVMWIHCQVQLKRCETSPSAVRMIIKIKAKDIYNNDPFKKKEGNIKEICTYIRTKRST